MGHFRTRNFEDVRSHCVHQRKVAVPLAREFSSLRLSGAVTYLFLLIWNMVIINARTFSVPIPESL